MTVYRVALILALAAVVPALYSQTEQTTRVKGQEHINQVIKELPPDSFLRRDLLEGARGNGIHYAWMDDLREKGIKRVAVCVDITFDMRGRPKQMSVSSTHYFSQYEGDSEISESERLKAIRVSDLEKQLDDLSLKEAAHSYWPDAPRPRPKPFVGGIKIQFLDDEWLPVPPALYSTSRVCP
jgi:hypothetical protein